MQRSERHHGMDWLRITAFALLILFHIGMVFSPSHWVVKSANIESWLTAPQALLTPWRLALLFAVSGYASQKLWAKHGDAGAFARSRLVRLLVPLTFAMAVLVPVEMWVRVRLNGYGMDYLSFWAVDYWRSGSFYGIVFPSWAHLWFVAYLFAYSSILAAMLALRGAWSGKLVGRFVAWFGIRHRLLWAPVALLVTVRLGLLFVVPEEVGLTTDWSGHAVFFPMFLAGFVIGGHAAIWPVIHSAARLSAGLAALSGGVVMAIELHYPGTAVPPHALMALDRAARVAMAWSMVLWLFAVADRYLNHDHRWRASLAEAVFPVYLVHHGAIVLTAWLLLPLSLPASAEFAILLSTTALACIGTYVIGRRIAWLRPLIGLSSRRPIDLRLKTKPSLG